MNAKWLGKYIITDIRRNCAKIQNSDDGKTIKYLININKKYNIGPYIINKQSILSIDS